VTEKALELVEVFAGGFCNNLLRALTYSFEPSLARRGDIGSAYVFQSASASP
jgi:hypothetical protein